MGHIAEQTGAIERVPHLNRFRPDLLGRKFCVSAKRFQVGAHIVNEQRSSTQKEGAGGNCDVVMKGTLKRARIGRIATLCADDAPLIMTATLYWLTSWLVTVTPVAAFEALSRMCRRSSWPSAPPLYVSHCALVC